MICLDNLRESKKLLDKEVCVNVLIDDELGLPKKLTGKSRNVPSVMASRTQRV